MTPMQGIVKQRRTMINAILSKRKQMTTFEKLLIYDFEMTLLKNQAKQTFGLSVL